MGTDRRGNFSSEREEWGRTRRGGRRASPHPPPTTARSVHPCMSVERQKENALEERSSHGFLLGFTGDSRHRGCAKLAGFHAISRANRGGKPALRDLGKDSCRRMQGRENPCGYVIQAKDTNGLLLACIPMTILCILA